MKKLLCVAVSKEEILKEKFYPLLSMMDEVSKNKDKLLRAKNTWEIYFPDYDNDSRETFQIPEIRNWIKKSLDAGVPWFYFLNFDPKTPGMFAILLAVYCSENESDGQLSVLLDKRKIVEFLEKNFDNLNQFTDKNGISEEISIEINDKVKDYLEYILH